MSRIIEWFRTPTLRDHYALEAKVKELEKRLGNLGDSADHRLTNLEDTVVELPWPVKTE